MKVILESLMKVDNSVADLFLNEGIDDVETFLDLDEQDFTRLRLKTKLIKTIQKIQKDYMNNPIIEELEEGDPLSISDNGNGEGNGGPSENPYRGILLEQAIDINIIFSKTPSGNEIMEVLNEEINPNDKLLNQINRILCEFLKLNYGLHPSTFHKNLLAVSLVNTYPVLGSTNRDVPQARAGILLRVVEMCVSFALLKKTAESVFRLSLILSFPQRSESSLCFYSAANAFVRHKELRINDEINTPCSSMSFDKTVNQTE
ncbi:uncharacterized protein LOC134222948 [Armigeres subalbatus]|uniref:uncharacterized protein LOC134222948 n=1 Tax=Armigeres subalbatus TaxID=124917 RepID=UPI002ED313D7